MDTLAFRLKAARNEAGLSQDELAEKVGMTRGGIGHLETGRRDGSTHLPKIADVLGVNALWLAEGKGPKEPLRFPTLEKKPGEPEEYDPTLHHENFPGWAEVEPAKGLAQRRIQRVSATDSNREGVGEMG